MYTAVTRALIAWGTRFEHEYISCTHNLLDTLFFFINMLPNAGSEVRKLSHNKEFQTDEASSIFVIFLNISILAIPVL